MCLVTPTPPTKSTRSTTTSREERNMPKRLPSGSPLRKGKLKRNVQTKSEQTKGNGRRRGAARARIWLLLVAGSFWSMYSIHKSAGREELSSVLIHEMEQESKYLATLFEKTAHDAREVLRGHHVMDESQSTSSNLNGPPGSDSSSNSNLRHLSSREQSAPPPSSNPLQYHNMVDFSHLEPERNHAIVVPYRDRKFHLEQFIEHMGPYLKRNFPDDTFELWVVEQDDSFLFNRAWLANVGITNIKLQNRNWKLQQAQQHAHLAENPGSTFPITVPPPPHCIILHDVDLIPTVDGVPYTNCSRPMQLGSELAHFNNSIPYPVYNGGVGPSMLLKHWLGINGMTNDFYGWGGEDDEAWHRLRLTGLLKKPVPRPTPAPAPDGKPYKGPKFWPPEIERPPKGFGKFRPISEAETVHHNLKNHNQWNRIGYMLELMQNNSARWKKDGLSDLKMTLTGDATTVTHLDSVEHTNSTTQSQTDPSVLSTLRATTTTMTKRHYVTAKQPGSIISSLSIEPTALASFAAIHHIKAIPKLTALEFVHVTQTEGSRIERAGAHAGIAWGACHYHHAQERDMGCPDITMPEWEGGAILRDGVEFTHDPWHNPLQDFENNPYRGRPTFAVVRNPYQRLIEFFYCPWNGYKGDNITAASLNAFIQNALYPPKPKEEEEDEKKKKKKKEDEKPPPPPAAYLHLRPQFHYVYAANHIASHSRPFVTHVLRFEHLETDFAKLMHLYNLDQVRLNWAQPPERQIVLTPKDFDAKTLKFIHQFYSGDFRRFGYKRFKVPESPSNSTKPHVQGAGSIQR